MGFHFLCRDIPFIFTGRDRARQWLHAILKKETKEAGPVTFVFTDDRFLLSVNRKHLGHNYLTDVITFAYSGWSVSGAKNRTKTISGDILISIERVTENAQKYRVPFHEELLRVMAHGMLHLCGYADDNKKELSVMRRKEDAYVQVYLKNQNRYQQQGLSDC